MTKIDTHIVTLTTDFGLTDGFVGILHGVILKIAPDAQIHDITHGIARQNIRQGAFVLANSTPYFPPAIHVCIVDPGVGSSRKPIAVQVGESVFVAPDNGVLTFALAAFEQATGETRRIFELQNPAYWLPQISRTFHGRDIFSPVAAHLAAGVPLAEMGAPLAEMISLPRTMPERNPDGSLIGHILYIDHYGNLITDVLQSDLQDLDPAHVRVQVDSHIIEGLSQSYTDVEAGALLALVSSTWSLEIAVREGSAAQLLNAHVGDPIYIRPDLHSTGAESPHPS